VGAPQELIRRAAASACCASLLFALPLCIGMRTAPAFAAEPSYVVTGSCRDGRPHGAYELRMPGGLLRVAGAFNHGKRVGTFLFWSSTGARLALLPFDDDVMTGTLALWYSSASAKTEPKRKLEAVYANGHPVSVRSWYGDGRQRAEFRYDRDTLAEARAWTGNGVPMSESAARAQAARDLAADAQFYNTLEGIVRDHPPPCAEIGRKP
jgi:hypothetical protein